MAQERLFTRNHEFSDIVSTLDSEGERKDPPIKILCSL